MNYLDILLAKQLGGGGEPSVTIEELDVTANGTYSAPSGKAYSPVVANVPNSYTASDEGKVVSSGALVAQTSQTIDTNGTYDTTLKNSVTVNVPNPSTGTLNITENGTYDVTEKASAVVNVSGGEVPENDVIFIDYDGTILYSYTAQQFSQLSEMPANPTHEGLTAQGWNWTLTDAKAYVADYGQLTIGQMYITDDGKTRIYVHIPNSESSMRRTMSIKIMSSTNSNTTIDWGDGATSKGGSISPSSSPIEHEYSIGGDYLITLTVNKGNISFRTSIVGGVTDNISKVRAPYIERINIGGDFNAIGNQAFYNCTALKSITIPNGAVFYNSGSSNQDFFYRCDELKALVLPTSVTLINGNGYFVDECRSLKYISVSGAIHTNLSAFGTFNCFQLQRIEYPRVGANMSLSRAFRNSVEMKSMCLPKQYIIDIPQYLVAGCYNLEKINFEDLAITSIPGSALQDNNKLYSITIPSAVQVLQTNAFGNSQALSEIHFTSATPPTLNTASFYTAIPINIYVPASAVEDYKTAWSSYADMIYAETE